MFEMIGIYLKFFSTKYYQPARCPTYEEVVTEQVRANFNITAYQGVWYAVLHDEPTQPSFCNCDTYNFTLTQPFEYESLMSAYCVPSFLLPGLKPFIRWTISPIQVIMNGKINQTRRGDHREGSLQNGAPYIPQFIVWTNKEQTRSIAYSCSENYLGLNVFHSLQIFSRSREISDSEKNQLIEFAHKDLKLDFDREKIKRTKFDDLHCVF